MISLQKQAWGQNASSRHGANDIFIEMTKVDSSMLTQLALWKSQSVIR